jgi:molybdate transport system substrate-binding protein
MASAGRFFVALILVLAAPARAEDVMVFAASSLSNVLEEIATAQHAESMPDVRFNFGASSDLARQIIAGAPADVFFSADPAQMDAVEKAGLVTAADRTDLLSNVLVAIVPAESKLELPNAAGLVSVERLALADPQAVPAGVYARKWLESMGLWTQVEPHVIPTLNVRAALAAVESGNADAGIVYKTDAATSKRARITFEVPAREGPSIVYVVAPLASARSDAARRFVERLRSKDAARVYDRAGFVVLAPR